MKNPKKPARLPRKAPSNQTGGTAWGKKLAAEISRMVQSADMKKLILLNFPYIIAFYAVLSFLEDFGYLPRLAVVFDALLHRFGIHGYAIIPTLLGFGCNVPGILATRVLESERERFIAATLISVGVPCVSIQAMLASTLGGFGMWYVGAVYFILFIVWLILGRLMHLTLSGYSPELIVEIPPYRLPSFKAWMNKLWFRIKDFFFEATPLVLGGILLVNHRPAGVDRQYSRALLPDGAGTAGSNRRTGSNGTLPQRYRDGAAHSA